MYSTQFAHEKCVYQGYRIGGALADTTNLPSPLHNAENTNGDSCKPYYSHDYGARQHYNYSPAPYPPLPPVAPAAPDAFYLPLPPHAPHFAQSCYSFSTPPAPAPYPPLPRAGAMAPTSLEGVYCQAAADIPLPTSGVPTLPQLVADYYSPEATVKAVQHQSASPPPPPPPPDAASVLLPPAADGRSTSPSPPPAGDNWLPSPPPLSWWEGPPLPPKPANAPPKRQQFETNSRSGNGPGASGGGSVSTNSSLQQQQQRSAPSSSSSSSASDRSRRKNEFPSRPQPPRASRNEGVAGKQAPEAAATARKSQRAQPRSTGPVDRSGKNSIGSSSGTKDAYVIPKKSESSSREKDPYTIPKKIGGGSQDQPNFAYTTSDLKLYRDTQSRYEKTGRSREDADDFHRSGTSGGRVGAGERRSEPDERHSYCNTKSPDNGGNGGNRYGGGNGRRFVSGMADDRDSYRHRARDDGAGRGFASSRERYGRSGEYDEDNRRGRGDGGRDSRRQGSGKSCPPPSAEKRRDARAGALSTAPSLSPEQERDRELAELTSKLTALELKASQGSPEEGKAADGGDAWKGKTHLSLDEYKEASAKGEIKPYKGTKYKTVDDRYADGWAYNPNTHRWVKVACQEKKAAIEALPALLARLKLMESKDKLATQRSQLLETKVEEMAEERTKEKQNGPPKVSLAMPTAPVLVVFDTNWLIHQLADTMCRVSDIAARQKDTSVLIPKEVLRELDRLKTRGRDEATRSSAQKANRYFRGLVEKPLEHGREFPVVRVQEDTELFRDKGHHCRPEDLGGDDSILNCCMFFTQGIDTPRKVTLITGDNNFAIRASAHGLMTMGRPQCDPGRCRMPLCPAPPRPSPFSRGY